MDGAISGPAFDNRGQYSGPPDNYYPVAIPEARARSTGRIGFNAG